MKKALLTVVKIYLATIILSIIGRFLFLAAQFDAARELTLGLILEAFVSGLQLDIAVAGYISTLPMVAILAGLWGGWRLSERVWRVALRSYLVVVAILISIIFATDALMYGYWGYKVDATLLPYLTSPTEASASVTWGDSLSWLIIFAISLFASFRLYRASVDGFKINPLSLKEQLLWSMKLLFASGLIFLGIRGGVSESVSNVSKVYFSSNQFANHTAVNPIFSLFSSVGRLEAFDQMYPIFEEEELHRRFDEIRGDKGVANPSASILKTPRPNVAIVIAESYTRYIMDMDVEGRAVMPNLREIASEGLLFENAYAAGARTDRGVASVLSGFPTQPKLSIMKIPAKSRNLPSIAASLKGEGYSSSLYYGGDLNFMDMASYLYSTGWERLSWSRDIPSPDETPRKWGYSDGVTMSHFADEVIALDQAGEPFVTALLTLSSHEPFDVPEDLGFEDRMVNSMAYSDAKLGDMVSRLKGSPAWDNLLLIIVADHTFAYPYRVNYNSPLRHHIPLIFSGGALAEGGVVERSFISQMDIAATLLSQMGISHSDYPFSRDIFDTSASAAPHYGYYTFSDGFGVVTAEGAVIYDNNMKSVLRATPRGDELKPLSSEDDLTPNERVALDRGKTTLQMTHYAIEKM